MKILTSRGGSASIIPLKGDDWLVKQRVAGKAVATALSTLKNLVAAQTTQSLNELNAVAEQIITDHGCTPTFKGYKGHSTTPFPAGVCISVNKHLVHGIPNDSRLQDGDVVSFDLGATFEGAIADSALTCIWGTPKSKRHTDLVEGTYESLRAGINAIQVGKRLGVIGNAIYKKAREYDLGVVTEYGGHGIDLNKPHAPPFVQNRALPEEGIVIQKGLTIAIEPMCVIGTPRTRILPDNWTVATDDIGAHFEHSIYVHEDKVEIITLREDEFT